MPLIQIEQDSPEVIERARQEMRRCVSTIDPESAAYVAVMTFLGYCSALFTERLISHEVYDQLTREVGRAVDQSGKGS
jgi:hypothetical protein